MDGGVVLIELAQHLDRFADGIGFGNGDVLGRHHAAGRAVLVAEEPANFRGVFNAHEAQKLFGLLVGEVADDVGGVVGVHAAEKSRRARIVEVFDKIGLVLVFHFRDGFGGLGIVKMLEHVCALLRIELLEDVGNVCGVQLVKAFVRDGKLHLGEVAIEQVHVIPGDDLLVDLLPKELGDGDNGPFEPGGESAQDAAEPHFGAQQAQL